MDGKVSLENTSFTCSDQNEKEIFIEKKDIPIFLTQSVTSEKI